MAVCCPHSFIRSHGAILGGFECVCGVLLLNKESQEQYSEGKTSVACVIHTRCPDFILMCFYSSTVVDDFCTFLSIFVHRLCIYCPKRQRKTTLFDCLTLKLQLQNDFDASP